MDEPIVRHEDGSMSFTGAGIEVYRVAAWRGAARLAQKGLKPRQATLAGWRKQFNSTARTWKQVEAECDAILAAYRAQMGEQ